MKWLAPLAPLALLAAAGASADKACEADHIVTVCLSTQTPRTGACSSNDWDCLCGAYEAIST